MSNTFSSVENYVVAEQKEKSGELPFKTRLRLSSFRFVIVDFKNLLIYMRW